MYHFIIIMFVKLAMKKQALAKNVVEQLIRLLTDKWNKIEIKKGMTIGI